MKASVLNLILPKNRSLYYFIQSLIQITLNTAFSGGTGKGSKKAKTPEPEPEPEPEAPPGTPPPQPGSDEWEYADQPVDQVSC